MIRRPLGLITFCLGVLAVVLTPPLTARGWNRAPADAVFTSLCAHASVNPRPAGDEAPFPGSAQCHDCVLCAHVVALHAPRDPALLVRAMRATRVAWRPIAAHAAPAAEIPAAQPRGPPANA